MGNGRDLLANVPPIGDHETSDGLGLVSVASGPGQGSDDRDVWPHRDETGFRGRARQPANLILRHRQYAGPRPPISSADHPSLTGAANSIDHSPSGVRRNIVEGGNQSHPASLEDQKNSQKRQWQPTT